MVFGEPKVALQALCGDEMLLFSLNHHCCIALRLVELKQKSKPESFGVIWCLSSQIACATNVSSEFDLKGSCWLVPGKVVRGIHKKRKKRRSFHRIISHVSQ